MQIFYCIDTWGALQAKPIDSVLGIEQTDLWLVDDFLLFLSLCRLGYVSEFHFNYTM